VEGSCASAWSCWGLRSEAPTTTSIDEAFKTEGAYLSQPEPSKEVIE
jgi:hypothetical protein